MGKARGKAAPKRSAGTSRYPTSRKSGRPSKLNAEIHERLVHLVSRGAYLAHAAASLRIGRRTIELWMSRGLHDAETAVDSPYARLYTDLDAARAEAVLWATGRVLDAGDRDWKANAWYLERVHPEHFGPMRDGAPRAAHALDLRALAEDETIEALTDGELELLDRSLSNAAKLLERAKARQQSG